MPLDAFKLAVADIFWKAIEAVGKRCDGPSSDLQKRLDSKQRYVLPLKYFRLKAFRMGSITCQYGL
jgi:hypothetical protein